MERDHADRPRRMKITVEELDSMRERERQLEAKVERLQAENSTLKWSLHVGAYDVRQLQALDVQLQENVRRLRHARDSMAAADERLRREARVLGDRNTRLKQENDTLATRIRDLSRQVLEAVDGRVQSLREDVAAWRRRHDDVERRYSRMRDNLDGYIAALKKEQERNAISERTNAALEKQASLYRRALRRHGIIEI